MYCKNCGKGIPDNSSFCRFCGLTVEKEAIKTSFKQIILNLFNLNKKKNLIEGIVLCTILIGLILPIYYIFPLSSDYDIYLLNGFICLVSSLSLSLFKKDRLWYLWSLLSGFIGYLFGSYAGIFVMIIPFMRSSNNQEINLGQIEKEYIYSYYKSGIILYLFGSIATLISFANPNENGNYTIFYGAVIWGLIKIFQGIYYQSKPELIVKKINERYEKEGEYPKGDNVFGITPRFKKFLVYFSIIIIFIIIIGLITEL